MTNKNILIVGSSGGIGKAFVDIFAEQNANTKIIGLSRSENKNIGKCSLVKNFMLVCLVKIFH